MKKLFSILLLNLMMLGSAQAAVISGQVHVNGVADASDPLKISFSNAYVSAVTGDFDDTIDPLIWPVSWGTPVTMYDLVFSSLGKLWEVGSYTYTLTSASGANSDHVQGVGIISDSSGKYEDSMAHFDLHLTGGATRLSFTSSTSVSAPSTMLLMGLGALFIVGGAAVRSGREKLLEDSTTA